MSTARLAPTAPRRPAPGSGRPSWRARPHYAATEARSDTLVSEHVARVVNRAGRLHGAQLIATKVWIGAALPCTADVMSWSMSARIPWAGSEVM